jgi:cyclomaltodextrinase / maltogenic alpha-amylase / neopullulanase
MALDGLDELRYATIWHAMIDRTAGADPKKDCFVPQFCGGNLAALTEKIPYLQNLNVTHLLLTPFFKATSYHGYNWVDPYAVDPRFGTEQDLDTLIEEAGKAGIAVGMDFVPNHCSSKHPFFKDAVSNPASPYRDWFTFHPDGSYAKFMYFRSLPKWNLDNPATAEYVLGAMKHWVQRPQSRGIKFIRVDHAIGVPHEFLQAAHDLLDDASSEYGFVPLIGEVWMNGLKEGDLPQLRLNRKREYLASPDPAAPFVEYSGQLDGFLDFKFHEIAVAVAAGALMEENAREFLLGQHYPRFPNQLLVSMLSSYDMNQFLSYTNKYELKRVAALQMLMPQPAIIKAGEERGMTHWSPIEAHTHRGDLEVRQPIDWKWAEPDIMDHYRRITENRATMRELYLNGIEHSMPAASTITSGQ